VTIKKKFVKICIGGKIIPLKKMMTNDDIKNAENAEKMPKKTRILRVGVSKPCFL
jgi:hypothetical protein